MARSRASRIFIDQRVWDVDHVNRVEASGQIVRATFLAADQRVHDLHAGKLEQYREHGALVGSLQDRTAHGPSGGASDLHARREAL
ncbi:protein of unknown function [Caballeronia sp. S22]